MARNRDIQFSRTAYGMRVTVENIHKQPHWLRKFLKTVFVYGNLTWLAYDRYAFLLFYGKWLRRLWQFTIELVELVRMVQQ